MEEEEEEVVVVVRVVQVVQVGDSLVFLYAGVVTFAGRVLPIEQRQL